jgi:hypothetical protein
MKNKARSLLSAISLLFVAACSEVSEADLLRPSNTSEEAVFYRNNLGIAELGNQTKELGSSMGYIDNSASRDICSIYFQVLNNLQNENMQPGPVLQSELKKLASGLNCK